MKKKVITLAAALAALSLTACAGQSAPATTVAPETTEPALVGIANPMVPVTSEDLRNAGLPINLPEGVGGISYYIIGENLGHAAFTLDSVGYYLRCSETGEDISGIYADVTQFIDADNIHIEQLTENSARATWYCGQLQYCLGTQNVADLNQFSEIAKSIAALNQ